jgi:hypothetical protein
MGTRGEKSEESQRLFGLEVVTLQCKQTTNSVFNHNEKMQKETTKEAWKRA